MRKPRNRKAGRRSGYVSSVVTKQKIAVGVRAAYAEDRQLMQRLKKLKKQ